MFITHVSLEFISGEEAFTAACGSASVTLNHSQHQRWQQWPSVFKLSLKSKLMLYVLVVKRQHVSALLFSIWSSSQTAQWKTFFTDLNFLAPLCSSACLFRCDRREKLRAHSSTGHLWGFCGEKNQFSRTEITVKWHDWQGGIRPWFIN